MDELTTYGSAWKSGAIWSIAPSVIPMDYVIRAAALWKKGEAYQVDFTAGTFPLCWVNTNSEEAGGDLEAGLTNGITD